MRSKRPKSIVMCVRRRGRMMHPVFLGKHIKENTLNIPKKQTKATYYIGGSMFITRLTRS